MSSSVFYFTVGKMKQKELYKTAIYCRLSLDDGYSGLNYNRPNFQRMLQDIENGKIDLVITKDLSRIGRDYIMTKHSYSIATLDIIHLNFVVGFHQIQSNI